MAYINFQRQNLFVCKRQYDFLNYAELSVIPSPLLTDI